MQSIDSMESSLSLTVQDFLRLRGGAGGQKKSELSSRKKPKAAAAEGSRLENAEKPSKVDANAAEPIHYTADSAKQFSELPHRFSVNDRIEVSVCCQTGLHPSTSEHAMGFECKQRCDATTNSQF